jgi:DNA-binding SARP family transcriptional activator
VGGLRVRVLGGLEVDGYAPQQVGSRKARTLVKVLALAQGRPVALDTLADAVWPGGAPGRPSDQLGVLVSRLRSALGAERLVRVEGGYSLAYDWLDLAELESRVAEARARLAAGATAAAGAVAGAAVALARGPLLPEDEGPWVEPARALAERLVAEAQAVTAEAALAAGDAATAAAAAGRALDRDPFDEAALRLLMRAHAQAGRPASALDAYARVRATLADALGVSPSAETEALHLAILQGAPAVTASSPAGGWSPASTGGPGGPPAAGTRPRPLLAGRDGELAWLTARLAEVRDGGAALVTVVGEPGIGKSALVTAWAAALADVTVLTAGCDALGRDLPLQPVLDAVDAALAGLPAEDVRAIVGPDLHTAGRFLTARGAFGPGAAPEAAGGAAGGGTAAGAGAMPGRGSVPGAAAGGGTAVGPGAATAARAVGVAGAVGAGMGALAPGLRATGSPDAGAERAALFAGLLGIVGRLGGGRPIVLVVEDVQAADEFTTDWLRFAGRRARGLLVVATRRLGARADALPGPALTLGPLDLAASAALVGADRAAALHERSGGHPLFLLALAAAPAPAPAAAAGGDAAAPGGPGGTAGPGLGGVVGDTAGEAGWGDAVGDGVDGGDVPAAITAAVAERLAALGAAAPTLVAAAVLGPAIDLGLLADVLGRPDAELLDDLEAGVAQRALVERGSGFAFAHELVREAAATTVSASRRALLHRQAARALRARTDAELLVVARHARLGGDRELAGEALVAAAGAAAGRSDYAGALALLDLSVALADGVAARLARARVKLVVRDLDGAAEDAATAVTGGAGVEGLEVAGWVAYYRRQLAAALRYAEEGLARAHDDELRASCLCLAGRVRQSQGDLAGSGDKLAGALDVATPALRPLAAIWLGALRVHQGRVPEADDLLARGLLDRSGLAHPFAVPHAQISQCHAAGIAGRVDEALTATAALLAAMEGGGDLGARYLPAARNYRAWVLRSVGRAGEADELNERARSATTAARMEEPFNQGTLDLADGALCAGDLDRAAALMAELRALDRPDTVMGWHQRERAGTLSARLALAAGRPAEAATLARSVAAEAAARGSVRHARVAAVVATLAEALVGEGARVAAPAPGFAPGPAFVPSTAAPYGSASSYGPLPGRQPAPLPATGPLPGRVAGAVAGDEWAGEPAGDHRAPPPDGVDGRVQALAAVESALDALAPVAGLEAWRWMAEAARLTGADRLRAAAERRAAAFLGAIAAPDRPPAERLVARWLG